VLTARGVKMLTPTSLNLNTKKFKEFKALCKTKDISVSYKIRQFIEGELNGK